MKDLLLKITLFSLFIIILVGCVQYEDLVYFRKIEKDDDSRVQLLNDTMGNYVALKVQRNDILAITVHSFDPNLAAPFNLIQPGTAGGAIGGGASPFTSYFVDEKGEIDFPVLGKINLLGMTASEAETLFIDSLKLYLKEPVVDIRFINFRISVLGEVNQPGTFVINNERITVLEALGMAGDLTPYSNRSNILVIREQNGYRLYGELNLQSDEIFKSEFFYLKQGDLIYVEPTQDIEASIKDQFSEYLPWVTSSLSAITTIIAILNSGK